MEGFILPYSSMLLGLKHTYTVYLGIYCNKPAFRTRDDTSWAGP